MAFESIIGSCAKLMASYDDGGHSDELKASVDFIHINYDCGTPIRPLIVVIHTKIK